MSLTVVDLFCGAGGFSHGFQQEGFDIVLGIDSELTVKDTFLANHPGTEFLHNDMRKVSSELLSSFGPVDVLIGSPHSQLELAAYFPNLKTVDGNQAFWCAVRFGKYWDGGWKKPSPPLSNADCFSESVRNIMASWEAES